jgi:integrase
LTSRNLHRLNARTVASLLKAGAKSGRHADGGGLYLSVGPGGGRRWVFLFRWHGRLREMGLGSAFDVSLQRARERAGEARALKAEGQNPLDTKRAAAEIPAFGPFALEMVEEWRPDWRNPKHAAQWKSTLESGAAKLKLIPVDKVDTEDVLRVLKPIWAKTPETASRLRGRIARVLDAAAAKGFREGENPARWKGHLDHLLPKPPKLSRGHHPAMSYADVPEFFRALKAREGMGARALEFLIYTAARSGEVRGATWAEMDLENNLWIVPGERMKAGKAHRVPLTDESVAVLKAVQPASGGKPDAIVFPGTHCKPLSDMSISAVLRRMGYASQQASVHGFRSSFRDWAGEVSTFPREVAEAALAHMVGNEVERAYRRGDALQKRRKLMQAWAGYLEAGAAPSGDVVTLRRGVG